MPEVLPSPRNMRLPGLGAHHERGRVTADESNDVVGLLDGLRTGDWLHEQDFPPVCWTLPGVIPEGSTLFVGPPKIGKSWFLLALCLALALGGRVLGLQVDRRPVLYLALEDGDRRLQDRCRRLLLTERIPGGFHYMTRCQPGLVLATVAEWLALHADEAPVVCLDTLGKVMPPALPGESSYQRDYRVGSALKRLVDDVPGSSLIVAHHDRKAESADFIDAVSGSNGLAGSADTIVLLSRARHELDGTLQVTGRDVPEGEYAVRYADGCRWELGADDLKASARLAIQRRSSIGLGDRSIEVVSIIADHPEGVRASEVGQALGIDPKTAGTYLGRLADAGRINRSARGLYTPMESVVSVEGEADRLFASNGYNTSNTPTEGPTS